MSFLSRLTTRQTAKSPPELCSEPLLSAPITHCEAPPMEQTQNDALAQVACLRREQDQLQHRCDELANQSQLNQDMFQQCSLDLIVKDREIEQLQASTVEHELFISELKECNRTLDSELLTMKGGLNNLTHTPLAPQIRMLEMQIDILATQLATANETADERELLIIKFKEQKPQLIVVNAEAAEVHAQQTDVLGILKAAYEAERQRSEADAHAQAKLITNLQDTLRIHESRTTMIAARPRRSSV